MAKKESNYEEVATGIKAKIEDDILTLKIKLDRPGTKSASGKTMVHCSSRGNKPIPDTDLILGLNIYSYANKK